MSNQLIDYKTKLNENHICLKNSVKPYMEEYGSIKEAVLRIDDLYATKLSEIKPQIMVYGIYNAGKSSIINELLGSDDARVADTPTTDSVDYYEWNGYKLADTPGVGAPIEHEYVTTEHLKKADVVIFVMSTSGSNEKAENYARMKDIVDAGKKVIIVLNDKNGDLGQNDENIRVIKTKVAENMKKIGIPDVDSKYCIIAVNAARAKKGRLENKQGMLQRSNIAELGKIVLTELKNTDNFAVIRNTIFEIEKNIEIIINNLEKCDNEEEIRCINNLLSSLRERKNNIRRDISDFIKFKTDKLGKNLPDVIWANRNNQDAVNEAVQKEIDKIVKNVKDEIEKYIEDMQAALAVDIKSLVDILEKIKIDSNMCSGIAVAPTKEPFEYCQVNETSEDRKERISGLILTSMEMLDNFKKNKTALMLPKAIGIVSDKIPVTVPVAEMVTKKLAQTTLGKTILKSTLGKTASKFIPVIGQALFAYEIVTFIGGILGNNDDKAIEAAQARNEYERRKAEADAQAQQELQQKCAYMADDIANELTQAMNEIINDVVSRFEIVFTQKMQSSTETRNNILNALAEMRNISNDYSMLYFQLGGSK